MSIIDYIIFGVYMLAVLGVGVFHFFRNKSSEDYYVGGRSIKAHHVGLSIVATDVGGGFSIGLGAYFWKRGSCAGALAGMLAGGTTALLLLTKVVVLPDGLAALELDPSLYGIICSLIFYFAGSILFPDTDRSKIQHQTS
jgi:SSS family solute:Na+ symporter